MTGNPALDALLFLLSLFFATLVSAAEYAIDAASRSRLELLEQEGHERAALCLRLKNEPERLRGAVQIASALLIVVAAGIVEYHVQSWVLGIATAVESVWYLPAVRLVSALSSAVLVAGIFLVFSSLYAKSFGTHYSESLCLRTAPLLSALTRLLTIPQRLLTSIANLLLRPSGRTARFGDAVMSEENLMDLIEEGTKTGVIDKTEHELIESIFSFTDKIAREIMIPRTNIVAVDYAMPPELILEKVVAEGFTRMPVYRGSLDTIIGVIYAKDVVSLIEHRDLIILEDIIRPPFIVPDTKPISDLLREFQRKRIHLAVVADEFGGTEGIITLEDILEEIVGEIRDEYDDESALFTRLPDGVLEVEGMMNISDFNSLFDYIIPESGDYDTVGGFITKVLGRLPERGDRCSFGPVDIEVMLASDRRVVRARFSLRQSDGADEADD